MKDLTQGSEAWLIVLFALPMLIGNVFQQMYKENDLLHFKVTRMIFDWESFRKIVNLGLPAGVQQLSVALGMMAIICFVNHFGTDVIAGFTAASRLDAFALMPSMNLSIAVSTFVGQNMGANKMERVRQGLRAALWMGAGFSILISASSSSARSPKNPRCERDLRS
jgi:Na+-driven multidrug efflux pump